MSEQDLPNPDEYFASKAKSGVPNGFGDQNASAEQDDLFSGDITDIEVWLRYKKFKLLKENEDAERLLRGEHAKKAYKFSKNWAIFIGILIIVYGFVPRSVFKLSEVEFMFVIGSLTASILAYYLLVIKYLFYRPKGINNSQE